MLVDNYFANHGMAKLFLQAVVHSCNYFFRWYSTQWKMLKIQGLIMFCWRSIDGKLWAYHLNASMTLFSKINERKSTIDVT